MDLDTLAQHADGDLEGFADALFSGRNWLGRLRALFERPGFATRAHALLERSELDGIEGSVVNAVKMMAKHMGEVGHAPAFALVEALALHHPERSVRVYAGHGLVAYGPRGIDAHAGPVGSEPVDPDPLVRALRVRSALLRGDPFDTLCAGSTEHQRAVLSAMAHDQQHYDRELGRRRPQHGFFDSDPRWPEWAARRLLVPALKSDAEFLLRMIPRARWKPVLDALRKEGRKRRRAKRPAARSLARLDQELASTHERLRTIVRELVAQGYAFEAEPLGAPAEDYDAKLATLEARIGPVPAAIAAFWRRIGSVDLRGDHPAWQCRSWYRSPADEPLWLTDPLCVISLDEALADSEDFHIANAIPGEEYELVLAADEVGKANQSGGRLYVLTPDPRLDARLLPRQHSFLEHLREAITWRGFPGFAAIEDRPGDRRGST